MKTSPLFSLFFAVTSLISFSSFASKWINADDLSLRNNIQLLADSGVILAPVTTYPLMWQSIIGDVNRANVEQLSNAQLYALSAIKKAYQKDHEQKHQSNITLYGATTEKRFTSFGNDNTDQGNLAVNYQYNGDWLSSNIQANYRVGIEDSYGTKQGNPFNFDHSYLAIELGNWFISAGAIDKWWGPSIDNNLILSTNARPLPAVSISRNDSKAFETPWLSWLGEWTLTAQMAKLESDRYVPDALLWSSRATIRPFRGLELGASWSLQWAGEGQPSSISDFWRAISGEKECANGEPSCDPELNTYLGNQLAGFDMRWSDTLFDLPYAIYAQQIGEDGSPNGLVTDKGSNYGAEIRFFALQQNLLLNVEYSDTQVACSGNYPNVLNCYYEHGTYKSGYRYHRRAIGSTYDNDAEVISTTLLGQLNNGDSWQVKLRLADLNTDNSDRYQDNNNLGNTVTKVAENFNQLDGQYQFNAWQSRFTLGALVSQSEIAPQSEIAKQSDTSFDAYFQWQYDLK